MVKNGILAFVVCGLLGSASVWANPPPTGGPVLRCESPDDPRFWASALIMCATRPGPVLDAWGCAEALLMMKQHRQCLWGQVPRNVTIH